MSLIILFAASLASVAPAQIQGGPAQIASSPETVTIDASPRGLRSRFRPRYAIGGSVDGTPVGTTLAVYQPQILNRLLDAGLGALSYRLNSELGVQAWHWNPSGEWSEPGGSRGYFTGTPSLGEPTVVSHTYNLPRNGFSHDQGSSSSYSRMTDGDPTTFWKSNPYLSSTYTGESDDKHPQWVVVDLGAVEWVDAIRIQWGDPYALTFDVTYWTGNDPLNSAGYGRWEHFPAGRRRITGGHDVLERLCDTRQPVRFVRVLMSRGSRTAPPGSTDIRDRLGFAIREIGLGTLAPNGEFVDLVAHDRDHNVQTATTVSSVDPWHTSQDVAVNPEQPGLDVALGSSLTRGLPAIVPVAMVYSTPDDAANEIRYLIARGYPIAGIELGEEPDGQFMTPEDYGALYVQFARAIRRVASHIPMGGPSLESDDLVQAWPDAKGDIDWLGRFVSYLRVRNAVGLLQFLSMEHYPLGAEQCTWRSLLAEPRRIEATAKRIAGYGTGLPLLETECNMSWEASDAYLSLLAAVWEADYLGAFLSTGGKAAYLYAYEPMPLQKGSIGWGTFCPFIGDAQCRPRTPTPEFFCSKLVTTEWCSPGISEHRLYSTSSDLAPLITAYAVRRPDDQWGVLLVNKGSSPQRVRVSIRGSTVSGGLRGSVTQCTFDPSVYVWHPNDQDGDASPAGPYATKTIDANDSTLYDLPGQSVVVLRGPGPGT